MISLREMSRRPRLRALLWLALVVRAFTPAGVMAEVRDDGGVVVQLCTASGPQTIWLPDPAAPAPGAGHEAGECLAALAAGAGLLPAHAGVSIPLATLHWSAPAVERPRAAVPSILRSQTPRGPPAGSPR